MRAAYIWANAFWQVSLLAGGAVMTYLDQSVWWIFGAIILMLLGSVGFAKQMDKWTATDTKGDGK